MALESLEFKEEDSDAGAFRRRLAFAFGMVILCFSVLVMRLAWLQIIKQDTYQQRAEQNRTVTTTNQGSRGLIFDRNGTLIAGNRLSWSIEITQDQTVEPVNRLIDRLAEVIKITPADRRRFRRLREDLNRYDGIPHPHGPHRCGSSRLYGSALALPRRRHQPERTPHLSGKCSRQPHYWLCQLTLAER